MTVPEPTVDPSWGDAPDKNEHAKFKNIYEITLNNSAVGYYLFSALNDIIFLTNFTLTNYIANDVFGELNTNACPNYDIYIPIIVNDGSNLINTYCYINSQGEMTLPNSYSNVDIYLIGISFNISANYFSLV